MNYPYNSNIYLAEVALNVENLDQEILFYQNVLGLELLAQSTQDASLGVDGKPLVRLIQTSEMSEPSYGLYHLAILLPNEQALGSLLKRLLRLNISLVGGADHGYSQALYLEDLEGNGIELYVDKPVTEWDIREDGRIVGVTEELDAQRLYEMGLEEEPFTIASGTRMGHVHLSIKDSQAASRFYQDLLDLEDKFSIPNASWIASGDYHHHLAVNEWGGKGLAERTKESTGLAYYVVEVADKEALLAIHAKAEKLSAPSQWLNSSLLEITDPDGIRTQVRVGL